MGELKKRLIFLITLFSISAILLSIALICYFSLKPNKLWDNYDGYLFSVIWTPSSCSKYEEGDENCFNKLKNLSIEKYFTIHGLWPTYLSGAYVNDQCKENEDILIEFKDKNFLDKMNNNWPGIIGKMDNNELWSHEFHKHGYCYMQRYYLNARNDYIKYFNISLSIFEKNNFKNIMEKILPDSFGVYNIDVDKFNSFLLATLNFNESSYLLICNNITNELVEIRFFLDFNFKIISPKNYKKPSNVCKNEFILNFTDNTKIPVYKKYDIYLLSLSWCPTFCINKKSCYNIIRKKKQKVFTIHGLWPNYKSGDIPQYCNLYHDINITFEESFYEILNNSWYSITTANEIFWTHEYNRHGFCYLQRINQDTNNYKIFFEKTLELYNKYNFSSIFEDIYNWIFPGLQKLNKTYLIPKLDAKFGKNTYHLNCINVNNTFYLSEIRFHFDLNFNLTNEVNYEISCKEEYFYIEFTEEYKEYTQDEYIDKNYDLYLFSMFWNPTDCIEKGYQCYDRISLGKKNIWTVHGLWPSYKNGIIGDWCNGKNDIDIEVKNGTLLKLMETYWTSTYHTNKYFWGHEFNRHGYCYNKRNNISVTDYESYFQKSLSIYFKYDFSNIFIDIYGNETKGIRDLKRSEIENYLEKKGLEKYTYLFVCRDVILDEENLTFISEIRVRFDLNFSLYKNETDKSEYDCPENFKAEFI